MTSSGEFLPVHLCGSVPLGSAREVFEAVADALAHRVRRYPDGETGERLDWLQWQSQFLRRCAELEEIESQSPYRGKQIQFRPRAGVDAAAIRLGPLGYAEEAIKSYADFAAVKRSGRIDSEARLLVSLPTPLACTRVHIAAAALPTVEPAYEAALRREIETMARSIPPEELAIQWDVAVEFSILELPERSPFPNPLDAIVERLVRITDAVPAPIKAGIHLCYGDSGHKHFKEPEDAGRLVAVANAVASRVGRRLDWVHMPVPRNRTDDAYFAPLKDLRLEPETELYLGLVHRTDGVQGTLERIAVARRATARFGIATECGFGRRPAETIAELLRIHREVSDAVAT